MSNKKKCDGRWEGYYIETSRKAFNKLEELGYEPTRFYFALSTSNYLYIDNESIFATSSDDKELKPFYLIDGEFTEENGDLLK